MAANLVRWVTLPFRDQMPNERIPMNSRPPLDPLSRWEPPPSGAVGAGGGTGTVTQDSNRGGKLRILAAHGGKP